MMIHWFLLQSQLVLCRVHSHAIGLDDDTITQCGKPTFVYHDIYYILTSWRHLFHPFTYSWAVMFGFLNPFMPSGFFYFESLDRSISSRRDVWFIFIITMLYRNSCIKRKQCRHSSDAAFCGVLSGSTLFANIPFGGARHKLVIAIFFQQNTLESKWSKAI